MTISITAEQRGALYDLILDRLSGIGDIAMALQDERYKIVKRLSREYSDDLRLLLDDLGFGDGKGGPVELTSPPEVLRRVLPRLKKQAEEQADSLESALVEVWEIGGRNRLISKACTSVLKDLGDHSFGADG